MRRRKRAVDLVAAAALLGFFAPLILLLGLLVMLDGGPPFYGHRRIGAEGRVFRCWKFRSMIVNADTMLDQILGSDASARAEWSRDFKLRCDPRITPIGRFLRKTSLDELPQLLNVLAGNMSLVGPRPIVEGEIDRYGSAFQAYCSCRPGITGLWQIAGRNNVEYGRRVELCERYVEGWALWLDFVILVKTVVVITRRIGAY